MKMEPGHLFESSPHYTLGIVNRWRIFQAEAEQTHSSPV